ncbi:acyl-CoA thioesterase [Streptomyces odonnellii]|uniref:acyl-CoA thioesterase n=1 Tax=Streptomyces odonnellii TaxID=1417980 RepID=UPI000625B25B|nr:thioesterase family protein [Streptomyces odonnellii]
MARHLYRCPLRWSDMDAFGHVNNVVFLRYLEEARIDFMFRLAPGDGSPSFSGGSVVARHEIDYKRPLVHRHTPVTVESWVTKINAASLTIAYEIKDDEYANEVYVRASTVVVPYDLAAGRPRRITEEERSFLLKYLDDDHTGTPGKSNDPDNADNTGNTGNDDDSKDALAA